MDLDDERADVVLSPRRSSPRSPRARSQRSPASARPSRQCARSSSATSTPTSPAMAAPKPSVSLMLARSNWPALRCSSVELSTAAGAAGTVRPPSGDPIRRLSDPTVVTHRGYAPTRLPSDTGSCHVCDRPVHHQGTSVYHQCESSRTLIRPSSARMPTHPRWSGRSSTAPIRARWCC